MNRHTQIDATDIAASAFLWPVYGFAGYFEREDIATFLDWSSAADFVQHPERFGAEKRNLFMGDPQYRVSGWGLAEQAAMRVGS